MYLLDLLLCFLFSFLLHSSNSGLSFYIDNITDILNWTTNIINSEAVCIGYESQYDNHGRSGCIIWVKRILLKVTIYIIHHNRFGFYLGVANIVPEEDNRADHNPMYGFAPQMGTYDRAHDSK